MIDLVRPGKTTSSEFTAWFTRAALAIVLMCGAIVLWVLIPEARLAGRWYRFWVALRPVLLGEGRAGGQN